MNYRQSENLVFRAGYYLSVARPQISYLSQTPAIFLSLAPVAGPNNDMPSLFVTKGNPNLKPSRTHSFDISAEYYDKNIGVLKVGAFYKRIRNLLENNSSTGEGVLSEVQDSLPEDPRFMDVVNNPQDYFVTVTIPSNNDDIATLWGFEATLEKQFSFLQGALEGFGVYANYTFTDSSRTQKYDWTRSPVLDGSGTVIGTETETINLRDVQFNGQAKHSGTAGIAYNLGGVDANLAYTIQSRRPIFFSPHGLSYYDEDYRTLDFRAEYHLDGSLGDLRIFVEAADLLRDSDEGSLFTTQGAGDSKTSKYYQSGQYFGGRQIRLGARVSF